MGSTTVRFSDIESHLIKDYAKSERRTVSDVIRLAILDRIEDEYDLELFYQAREEFTHDPVTSTHSELLRKYGLAE